MAMSKHILSTTMTSRPQKHNENLQEIFQLPVFLFSEVARKRMWTELQILVIKCQQNQQSRNMTSVDRLQVTKQSNIKQMHYKFYRYESYNIHFFVKVHFF